uniref:Uncharacterized protein n=1 Tax=Timema bartmani TaxID=61472 RepID=A0A7R9EY25_9NEOP|nr:unnamed protein product [Timema bartmani]
MNLSAEKMFEELPGPISFATSRDAKLDLGQAPPPLNIKYETQSFPILLDCVKEEKLIENYEQNYEQPLFSNDHKMNEVKKEDQTPWSPSVPNVKVEVGAEYMTQSANIAIQSSDEINMCKVTNKIAEDDSEEVHKNLEKDTQDNSNKCAQHQSEKDVQDGAKIVPTDHTSQGWNTLFLSIIVVLVVVGLISLVTTHWVPLSKLSCQVVGFVDVYTPMKMRATATIVEQLVRRDGTQNVVDYLLGG